MQRGKFWAGVLSGVASLGAALPAMAIGPVNVPGHSFETPIVDPNILPIGLSADFWTINSTGFGNGGTFPNANPGATGFPDNSHGDGVGFDQVAYMFELTGNRFFQTLPTLFETTNQYTLTVGLGVGGTFPVPATDKFHLRLGYLTDPNDILTLVTVSSTTITRNPGSDGLANNHLLDINAVSPFLTGLDTAIGKPITILMSTEKFSAPEVGGQFIFDNVRLVAVPEPTSLMTLAAAGAIMLRQRRAARAAKIGVDC